MGIDKHYILTIEKSADRRQAMLGGTRALQTPLDKIKFIKGRTPDAFNDDMRLIGNAARADGFAFVEQFGRGLSDAVVAQSASGVIQTWNIARILRHIADGDETVLFTWDDRITTLPFPFIDRITTALQERDEEFFAFQLRVRIGDALYQYIDYKKVSLFYPHVLPEITQQRYKTMLAEDYDGFKKLFDTQIENEYQQFINSHYYGAEMTAHPLVYINKYLQQNLIGYDESLVLSPKGAGWLLLQALKMEDIDDSQETADTPYYETAVHRRNTFDCFMMHDLKPSVDVAIADNKGLYCPKNLTSRYVHDWLPMSSNVDWAQKENEDVETLRTLATDVEYLEID